MKNYVKYLCLALLFLSTSLFGYSADYSGIYRMKGPRSSRNVLDVDGKLVVKSTTGNTKLDMTELWEIRAVGDAYVIINAASGRMLQAQTATQKEHSLSATSCSLFYIKKDGTKYIVSSNADFSGYSCLHEDSGNKIVVWNQTETNSKWTFSKPTASSGELEAAAASIAPYESLISKAIEKAGKISVLDNGGIFRLKSRYNHYAYETSTKKVQATATRKANDLTQIWVIVKDGSKFHIRNASTGRYLPTSAGSDTALETVAESTNYYIKVSEYSSEYFTISWKEDFSGANCLHENARSLVVKWNANNAADNTSYSDWTIEPVDENDTDATLEKLRKHMAEMQGIATEVTTGTYRLVNALYPARALTEDASAKKLVANPITDRYSQVWRLTVNGNTCTMQNVLTENYAKNSASTSAQFQTQTSGTTAVNFTIGEGGGDWDCFFNFRGSSTGMHCDANNNIVGYDVNATASQWILYPVTVDDAALAAERQEVEQTEQIRKNTATYNEKLQKYFADYACTEFRDEYKDFTAEQLREAMTQDEIPSLLQDMAVCVLTGIWNEARNEKQNGWEKFFRIQDVECYSSNTKWQEITKVGPFGELTSPTGIQGKAGDYVYIFVAETPKTDATIRALLAYDTEYRNKGELSLKKGINVWQLPAEGEVFINYFCNNTAKYLKDFPKIRVHIEGATANGCWDLSRGMTNSDWTYLKGSTSKFFTGEFLHVKGLNTVLNVLKDNVKPATKPVEIMKGWDNAFLGLQYVIGHDGQWDGRYNPVVNPRHSYSGNPNWGGYGGSNHTTISSGYLFNYDNFYEGNVWEILHEIGHGCQYPIKMAGTTEVTNNSLAQCVNYLMGRNYSRGNGTDKMVQLFNYPDPAGTDKRGWSWVDYVRYATPHYDASLHTGNHIWFQLFMYFDVLGNCPGFMGRLNDAMRADPIRTSGKGDINGTPATYADDFWKVAKAAATVSQTDLWEFFEAYGFWKYADEIISTSDDDPAVGSAAYNRGNRFIGDYGNYSMKLPVRDNAADEAALAELKAYMHNMPKKAPNVMFLDDRIEKELVRDDCFVATIKSSLVGKELLQYWNLPSIPDYGHYTYFDGKDRTSGLSYSVGTKDVTYNFTTDKGGTWNYSITGREVTMQGTGILGIKVYDADGKLCWLANTQKFVIPTDMAEGLKTGAYKLYVAATASLDIEMDKEGNPIIPEGVGQLTTDNGQRTTGRCYDLMGRTFNHQPKSGLYIKGGQKVLVR